jgi:DNA transposition AAA+ family ATPase
MQKVIDSINKYFAENPDVSREKFAKIAGISGGALSAFLAGQYKGRNENIAKKIAAALAAEQSRRKAALAVREPELIETSVMRQMYFGLDYARDRNDIIIIYGAPGVGKTVTLEKWAKENPAGINFTASPNTSTKRAVMDELLEALGKKPDGRCDKLQRAIIAALKNSNRPVVIDEAHFLRLEALETLRSIHDATKCPLVLVGNPMIMEKITERNKNITGQFFSRAVRIALDDSIPLDDVKGIVLQNGIELDEECLNELYKVANGVGAFRVMTKMFLFAWTIANKCKAAISLEHILSAKKVIVSV